MAKKTTDTSSKDSAQLSLFDDLLAQLNNAGGKISSDQITAVISKLTSARDRAKKREAQEKKQKEEEEAARKRLEEQARKSQHIQEVTSMDLPLDWENLFAGDSRAEGIHADSIPDGLILSLANLGRVDIEYIASITGEDLKTVITTLKGSIYQNPDTWNECFYKGWETAEEYLSGNMVQKWKTAKSANTKYRGYFADNVAAIEKVLPPTLSAEDIYITLGSPWVPEDIIDAFIRYILKTDDTYCYTTHDTYTGSWEIANKSLYNNRVAAKSTYGTERLTALYILERTLNMKTICVTDEVVCNTNKSGKKRVINQSETVAVLEKQKKLIETFQKWVWKDPERKARLWSKGFDRIQCCFADADKRTS